MSSTARVLSAAALASAVVGFAASAALADPGAEVSPSTGSPGGSVTVSVTCESTGGPPPETLEATSDAFDEGTVQLQRVPGNDEETAGAAYRGTAHIASDGDLGADSPDAVTQNSAWTVDGACPAAPGGQGKPWTAKFQVNRADGGGNSRPVVDDSSWPAVGDSSRPGVGDSSWPAVGDSSRPGVGDSSWPAVGDSSRPGVGDSSWPGVGDSSRPGVGDSSRPGTGDDHACVEPNADSCAAPTIQHGVQAGEGGTFTDSVPALVAGGILIAGALGAAVYRLRHRDSATGR